MARTFATPLILAAALLLGHAQSPLANPELEAFLTELQQAVGATDREAVAAMIRYPLTVSIAGLRVPINDTADFLARYDDLFTDAMRGEIARASALPATGRTPVDVTPAGLSIKSGLMIIERVGGHLRIVSMAVPRVEDAVPGTTASAASTSAAIPQAPRRVSIRVGPKPTQVAGSLAIDAVDSYLVFVPKGHTLGVRIERAPAGTAIIRVTHARTGAPLNPKMVEGRVVSGAAADGADYRIEVRRLADSDTSPLPYMLALTVR